MRRIAMVMLCLPTLACQGTARQESQPAARRPALVDSATIHKLCAMPDSVLAGRRDCVLKDQSPPPPKRVP